MRLRFKLSDSNLPYEVRVRTNQAGPGWRMRLGNWLHELAHRCDGRWWLAFDIQSEPPLTKRLQAECVEWARDQVLKQAMTLARHEQLERLCREEWPDLYGEQRR